MKSNISLTVFLIVICANIYTSIVSAGDSDTELTQCGQVIGHEMGMWEFFDISPNPEQVDRVLKTRVKFVKVSLHRMKDGTWVVNHDPKRYAELGNGEVREIVFKDTTWPEIVELQSQEGSWVPVYRLRDYVTRDRGQLCWLIDMKDPVDHGLLDELKALRSEDRTVIEAESLEDVKFLVSMPVETSLHFSARIYSDEAVLQTLLPDLQKAGDRLWAIEIDPGKQAPSLIQAAHTRGFKAYVDSMRYSWNYELFSTACRKVFEFGADYTQTNRPLQCLKEMNL